MSNNADFYFAIQPIVARNSPLTGVRAVRSPHPGEAATGLGLFVRCPHTGALTRVADRRELVKVEAIRDALLDAIADAYRRGTEAGIAQCENAIRTRPGFIGRIIATVRRFFS